MATVPVPDSSGSSIVMIVAVIALVVIVGFLLYSLRLSSELPSTTNEPGVNITIPLPTGGSEPGNGY